MFPFVLWPTGGAVAIISQGDAVVISAIVAAIPVTIMATVAAYNARMARKQLRPNGGDSTRDVLDTVLTELRELKSDVRSIRDDQRSDHARITRLENPS